MLRRFLISSCHRSRISINSRPSRGQSDCSELTLNAYHVVSDNKLEELSEKLEATLEDEFNKGADVCLNNGVLTVVVDNQNTYVINKQTPNRQIWLSSPLSGPKRFDFVRGEWVERTDRIELNELLSIELSQLLKKQHKI